jgi:hypothetical protein
LLHRRQGHDLRFLNFQHRGACLGTCHVCSPFSIAADMTGLPGFTGGKSGIIDSRGLDARSTCASISLRVPVYIMSFSGWCNGQTATPG